MQQDCQSTITHCLRACTPVKLKVTSELGDTNIECGEPRICSTSKPSCHRTNCCEFTVEQIIMVEIPIRYLIKTDVGDTRQYPLTHTESYSMV